MVQNFHEIAENHMNVNLRDKNFVIATFFRDYRHAAAPARTIHIVAPPIIPVADLGGEPWIPPFSQVYIQDSSKLATI